MGAEATNGVLFVADRPFRCGTQARELLEMMLSAAAFNLDTALLLRGPGTTWLQVPECLEQLGELPVYGADSLYVSHEDLSGWGDPAVPPFVTPLPSPEVRDLYRRYGRVIQP